MAGALVPDLSSLSTIFLQFPRTVVLLSITQTVEFFFPFTELRRFEQFDITINSAIVPINGESAELDLQKAESDLR